VFTGSFLFFIDRLICFALGFIMMQGMYGPPVMPEEDQLLRATTPPENFVNFNGDFSSRDLNQFFSWINPDYGLVTNGILLTKEEAQQQFSSLFAGQGSNNLMSMDFYFNYGIYTGADTFMADCWLELKLWEDGNENWYKMHHQLVFKMRSDGWSLMQWEYIPSDIGLSLDFQSLLATDEGVPEQFRDFIPMNRGSNTALEGINGWPLLIGSNFTEENTTQPIQGKTPSGSIWKLTDAVAEGKPTVLYFFSVADLMTETEEEFEAEMNYLSGLYSTFGYQDLYIFGVTDSLMDEVEWMGESGYDDFALLLDEGSMIHATMNIAGYPFIVVINSSGTVVAICRTYRPEVLPIIERRILETVNGSSPVN
jgi:hypothetical protein